MISRAFRRIASLFTGLRRWRPRKPGRRGVVGALVVVLAGLFTAGGLAQVRIDTGIGSFLPSRDPAMQAMQEKARSFGGDPIAVLLESPQPRQLLLGQNQLTGLLRLEGTLAKTPDVAQVYGPGTVVNQIAIGAQNLIAQISGRRDALRQATEQQAKGRGADARRAAEAGQQAMADFDRRYGSLLVSALPAGLPTLGNPKFVDTVVFGPSGQARPQWRGIVPDERTVAVLVRPRDGLDQAGTGRLVDQVRAKVSQAGLQTSRVTVTGVPSVTAALSDRVQKEFPLLGGLALAVVGLIYLLMPWSSRRRSRLRPLLTALAGTTLTLAVFGWLSQSLSLGVVAFLPILLGIGSDFPLYLAQPAQRRRVLVAALAGAAGFAALTVSSLPFVRELGIALAVGIVVIVLVALALRRWFDVVPPAEKTPVYVHSRQWSWRVRVPVLVISVAVAAVGWIALPKAEIEARPDKLAQGLPALTDAEYAERVMGAAGEVNIALRGPDVLTPAALQWSRQAEDVVNQGYADKVHPITTVSDLLQFLGGNPSVDQIQSAVDLLPSYLTSAVVRPDRQMSLMVMGIELEPVRDQLATLNGLRAALPPPPPGYQADVTGLPVAAAHGYQAVSQDRMLMSVLAIVLSGLVLLIGLRERRDAARAVLTVALSAGWVLAFAWLVSGTFSPLTVAIGALTTATGCEFAVMLSESRRRRKPWLVRSVGLAALAAVGGYAALTLSDLAALREFGMLLAAGVVTSCLAAWTVVFVVLPPSENDGEPGAEPESETATPPKEEVTV